MTLVKVVAATALIGAFALLWLLEPPTEEESWQVHKWWQGGE